MWFQNGIHLQFIYLYTLSRCFLYNLQSIIRVLYSKQLDRSNIRWLYVVWLSFIKHDVITFYHIYIKVSRNGSCTWNKILQLTIKPIRIKESISLTFDLFLTNLLKSTAGNSSCLDHIIHTEPWNGDEEIEWR